MGERVSQEILQSLKKEKEYFKEITKSPFLSLDLVKSLQESDFVHFFEGKIEIPS